jgi:hypothetical protein
VIQADLFDEAPKPASPGTRQFFEVGAFGVFALNKWASDYIEREEPRFGRKPPSPHHIYVGTRTTSPSLTRSLGWLDTSQHILREVKDNAVIKAILDAEQAADRKMERIVARTKATDLRELDA